MAQIGIVTDAVLDKILVDLTAGFHVRSEGEAVQHALRLAHVLLQVANDEVVTLVNCQNVAHKLSLSANPFSRLIAKNQALRDRHAGQRGFIVCNGPSVKTQNLLPLKDEVAMFVHSGYQHPHYADIRPRYHCVAPAHFNQKLTPEAYVAWLREMHAGLGDAELFLNAADENLAQRAGMIPDRIIHWMDVRGLLEMRPDRRPFDLSRTVPGIQSVPVMCLMIMMYLGFKEVYLIGVEHSEWKTGSYTYFYDKSALDGKDESVDDSGRVTLRNYDLLNVMLRLWGQYRFMGELARVNGVRIFNATAGGELDEFERIRLEDVLASPRPGA